MAFEIFDFEAYQKKMRESLGIYKPPDGFVVINGAVVSDGRPTEASQLASEVYLAMDWPTFIDVE